MTPYTNILQGDCLTLLKTLPAESVNCCVTSPPYWGLRDYDVEGQLGLEKTPEEYIQNLVAVFREVKRILRNDGTLWLNLGDSYASAWACNRRSQVGLGSFEDGSRAGGKRPNRLVNGLKEKDLVGIPWSVAFALRADGWYLRSDIIWAKPNPMPESVRDRPTKAHEYIFLFSKLPQYFYDHEAIKEPVIKGAAGSKFNKGKTAEHQQNRSSDKERKDTDKKNKRSVWAITTKPFKGAHFATFPPDLIKPCILAGCPPGGVVIDPFGGSGTTGLVANAEGRNSILIELNPAYVSIIEDRVGVNKERVA